MVPDSIVPATSGLKVNPVYVFRVAVAVAPVVPVRFSVSVSV